MSIPQEFTAEAVAQLNDEATAGGLAYRAFHDSQEPYRSLIDHNPWLRPPDPEQQLEWDAGWYYDTTIGRLHADWCDKGLPVPTRDAMQLQRDFVEWGYCLVEDGVSADQCTVLYNRVAEQAEAERRLGIAHVSPAQQHLWALINKGEVFEACMQHDAGAVQSGPLLEYLLDEFLGRGWHHLSCIANISFPGCHPQGLHQDQSLIAPYVTERAPVLVNTVYILQDVDQHNGGTLLIPGSHRLQRDAEQQFGELPRPINLEAPAGTILLMDGRVLHGGAVNHSDKLRYIITNSVVRPWVRQQECFHLTIRPEVLARASDKLLYRCGFQATAANSMVEGYGYAGSGREGDGNGALQHARQIMDAGNYSWVGPLDPSSLEGMRAEHFTLGQIQQTHERARGKRFQRLLERMDSSAG
ncbi:MAG: phytanoyl-CoA dioxygenase family protein [Pseudomonadales bacterium]